MKSFNVYTLHPNIFHSFVSNSLIARGISEEVIEINTINWRDKHGFGNYKQVDDKGFGGGDGMVLKPEPIVACLREHHGISSYTRLPDVQTPHSRQTPPNLEKLKYIKELGETPAKLTISLTPRGWKYDQRIAEYLSTIPQLHILCGRYEGFDARVSEYVDLELSLGDFVLNGGEVAAMALIESVARLEPGFIPKFSSVLHDSFSQDINSYQEQNEYVQEKHINPIHHTSFIDSLDVYHQQWLASVNMLEHPHYTRPRVFEEMEVPDILTQGDHTAIHKWRNSWFKNC